MADTPETATPKPAAAPPTKADFVRSLPTSLSPSEVVAKAMAAGLTITNGYVSNIRFEAKARKKKKGAAKKAAKAPAAAAKKAPAKKSAAPAKKPAATKAPARPAAKGRRSNRANPKKAFIASMPSSTPAADVVAAAKKAGLSFSVHYVYKLRSKSRGSKPTVATKAAPATVPVKRGPGRPKGSRNKASAVATTVAPKQSSGSSGMEQVLARFVVAHGADRVRQVLATVESRVNQLFGA
ncbi:MAG: hypothetical protein ACHREM_09820 [Polyangiales bacterium]